MLAGPILAPETYAFDAAAPRRAELARKDLRDGFASWRLAWALARLDLRNRYRGSVIGPFWMTLSTALMILGLGLLYSRLLGLSLADYLPHLTVSLVVWNVVNAMVTDACIAMTHAEGVIRQLRVPFTVHALRSVFRNALTAAHSLPLILVVFAIFGHLPGPEAPLAILGLILLMANAFFASLFLGMVCARFRDVGPIVANIMQLAFFLTPILWKPELLKGLAVWLPLNPFYAVLETMRGPLVEGGGAPLVWLAAVVYTVVLGAVSLTFFARFRGRLAFWV
ncbi:ABC transporter permease [Pararoseomonas indoligenes]|uniref:ABC transporter permease n=1 Tax=Roseomonas indoligenes TaxID=2820811 RepID=A0A940S745_9PROT|nr:ABC transporter permease [Pararoseomonas indoligenes]MBP0494684.1 ABC transporter permease [Pararoseomonas indoligenes]